MLRLITADHSGAPPTVIARCTGLPMSAVSMAAAKLEKDGLIEKRFLSRDKRSVMFYLTEEGRRWASAMEDAMVDYSDDVKNREGRVHP